MILVDTGPIVALFDPRDDSHEKAKDTLAALRRPLVTTVPVLTEVFHLLDPATRGADAVREFVAARGLKLWFLNDASLSSVVSYQSSGIAGWHGLRPPIGDC